MVRRCAPSLPDGYDDHKARVAQAYQGVSQRCVTRVLQLERYVKSMVNAGPMKSVRLGLLKGAG